MTKPKNQNNIHVFQKPTLHFQKLLDAIHLQLLHYSLLYFIQCDSFDLNKITTAMKKMTKIKKPVCYFFVFLAVSLIHLFRHYGESSY